MVSAFVVGLAVSAAGAAVSEAQPAPARCTGQAVALAVVGNSGSFEIPVARGNITTVVFPRPIIDPVHAASADFKIGKLNQHGIIVVPALSARAGAVIDVTLQTGLDPRLPSTTANIRFLVIDDAASATTSAMAIESAPGPTAVASAVCLPLDLSSALNAHHALTIADKDAQISFLKQTLDVVQAHIDELEAQHQSDQNRLTLETTQGVQRRILTEAIRAREHNIALTEKQLRGKRGVFIRDPGWDTVAGNHLLHFTIYNNDPRAFRVRSVRALDDLAEQDLVILAKIGTRDEPMNGASLAIIAPHSYVEAAIAVKPFLSSSHLTLAMTESEGDRTIISEPIRHWNWEFPPEGNEDLVTLSIKALGGAIWLSDGLNNGRLGQTSFRGAGVRVTYGFTKYVNIEVEAAGASTGEACIEHIEYQGMQGELFRRATIGRLNMGGLLRFGSGRFLPTARLGVGLQGSSESRRLVDDNDVTLLDEDAIEVAFSIVGGVGLDIRLVNGFYLGTGIALEQQLSSDARAFEAAINLGYAWRP